MWRGGRPLKKSTPESKQASKPAKVNGTNKDVVMIIDSDDEEPAPPSVPQAEFEDEEEELDPDQPYSTIIQEVRLALNTEVLHIAIPQIPAVSALRPADTIPPMFSTKLVFAVACADSTVRVITLPLSPPSDAAKAKPLSPKSQIGEEIVRIHGHQTVARGLTMTWTSRNDHTYKDGAGDGMDVDGGEDITATPGRQRRKQQARPRSRPTEDGFDLLVASHSSELGGLIKIWRFQLAEASLNVAHPIAPYKTLTLRKPAARIAFSTAQYPKRRHSQLLIADVAGTARIYDLLAPSNRKQTSSASQAEPGAFVATLRSTFESVKSNSLTPAILATRKAIIDAAWTSDGYQILALLADGEWGVWDVDRSGPSPPADPSAFALRGFVGTTEKEGSSGGPSSPKRGSRNTLAPMTPNTRRRKEETLFQGSSSSLTVAARGGLSVASLPSTNGAAPEDSVIIWYGSEIYRIADFAKFWARTASASSGNSLPSPGLAQISGVSLFGEAITSMSQFDTTTEAARLAKPRDVLLSAEHRLIITESIDQNSGRRFESMFAQEQADNEDTRKTDQALLSHGELDLGGMDRLMDNMQGSGTLSKNLTLGNPRKVLFASSAA